MYVAIPITIISFFYLIYYSDNVSYPIAHFSCQIDLLSIYLGVLTLSVHLADNLHQFRFGGVLSEGPHDTSQLCGADHTVLVLVKQEKRLVELYKMSRGKCEAL